MSGEQVNQVRIEREQKKCQPANDSRTRPFQSCQKQEHARSDKADGAQQTSRRSASPERVDRSQRRYQQVRQREPHRSELPQAGFEVVEQTAGLINMSNCVDMYKCLVSKKKEQEGSNNQDGGNDGNIYMIMRVSR